jgi:hypothetical protein
VPRKPRIPRPLEPSPSSSSPEPRREWWEEGEIARNDLKFMERVSRGFYEPKPTYPERPHKPELLRKRIEELDDVELAVARETRDAYQQAESDFRAAQQAYREEEARCRQAFEADLCRYSGLAYSHPYTTRALALAWDEGHASGLSDVVQCFDKYLELWDLARNS